MAGHLGTYHALAAVLLVGVSYLFGLPLGPIGVLAGLGFSAFTHGLLDRRWPVRVILRASRSPKFAETTAPVCGMYTADQALHHLAPPVSAVLIARL